VSLGRSLSGSLFRGNPFASVALGLCPALAVSTTLKNGLAMAAATLAVLVGSAAIMALVAGVLPRRARMACMVVVIAGLVTVVDWVMTTHMPGLRSGLGIYLPLITANCMVFGHASRSSSGDLRAAIGGGLGAGLGFAAAICLVSVIREVLGSGTLWDAPVLGADYNPVLMLALAPGGLITLGLLMGVFNTGRRRE
jgi:H+/Na+-translocating ferredoxin:NAD+ oxidoreductase subunit E